MIVVPGEGDIDIRAIEAKVLVETKTEGGIVGLELIPKQADHGGEDTNGHDLGFIFFYLSLACWT